MGRQFFVKQEWYQRLINSELEIHNDTKIQSNKHLIFFYAQDQHSRASAFKDRILNKFLDIRKRNDFFVLKLLPPTQVNSLHFATCIAIDAETPTIFNAHLHSERSYKDANLFDYLVFAKAQDKHRKAIHYEFDDFIYSSSIGESLYFFSGLFFCGL